MGDSGMPARRLRTPIWLDCDTGHDDALAILLAARSTDVMLLGISTVYGNAPLDHTTYNTRAILKAIAREDVPVYAGAEKPFQREAVHAPSIHGESGLDGTTCLPKPTVGVETDVSAVEAMRRALMAEEKGKAWLVATGALTNVAALVRDYPNLVEHIAGLSIMGGAVGGGFTSAQMGTVNGSGERFGNHTPYAEFNIYCDPDSAQQVFSNTALAAKTTLIPLDLTHQFLATSQVQMRLLFGYGSTSTAEPTLASTSPVRRLFFEILNFFAKTYADVFGLKAGPPTHDPLAVAAAFRPDLFHCNMDGRQEGDQTERFNVQVITEGEHGSSEEILNGPSQCGRTIVTAVAPAETGGVKIPRGLETMDLWSLIEGCLRHAEHAVRKKSSTSSAAEPSPTSEIEAYAHANEMASLVHAPPQYRAPSLQGGGAVRMKPVRDTNRDVLDMPALAAAGDKASSPGVGHFDLSGEYELGMSDVARSGGIQR